MIVADANIVTYLLVDGTHTRAARRAFARDNDWRLPALWRFEFANAIVNMLKAGFLSPAEADDVIERGINLFADGEHDVDPQVIVKHAIARRLSAYDASYVALAEALDVRCLTEDQILLERAPRLTVTPARFASKG